MLDPTKCPICRDGQPRDIVARLDVSWVSLPDPPPLRGYAVLVFHRHAVELHDLTADEGAAFMRDVQRLSRAVSEITGAAKLNYEIHGNTIPHLHLHLFPRYPDDPFVGRPIHPKETTPYAAGEYERLREQLAALLGAGRR